MKTTPCKSCGAQIFFAETVAGKRIPLDPEPDADGNISLLPAGATVLTRAQVEEGKNVGSTRYRSHYVTCPDAKSYRRRSP